MVGVAYAIYAIGVAFTLVSMIFYSDDDSDGYVN